MELWTGMSYGISVWSSEQAWVIYGVPIWSSEQARVMGFRYGTLNRHELWGVLMELWTGMNYGISVWSSEQAWVMRSSDVELWTSILWVGNGCILNEDFGALESLCMKRTNQLPWKSTPSSVSRNLFFSLSFPECPLRTLQCPPAIVLASIFPPSLQSWCVDKPLKRHTLQ